jgi:addiction module RelE/StbE family toxin
LSRRLSNGLAWRPLALEDREAIMAHIARDHVQAAIDLDMAFEDHAERARLNPKLYKPGRVQGTREIVVRPNYVMVYREWEGGVEVLRVLHAAQQWP